MRKYIRIGVDIAKNSFQVHALESEDCSATKRKLSRSGIVKFLAEVEPCAIGMEACGSAHYWARRFRAMGHEVKLTPPIYVKPYVKRGKNDAADAAAICEAMSRPNMRFVAVKSEDQQATLMAHKTRELLIKQRTMSVNALRGHLAEFGVIAAKGISHVEELVERAAADLPAMVQATLGVLLAQLRSLDAAIDELERAIVADHRRDPVSRLAASVPGVGALAASAILASAPDPQAFKSGPRFRRLAWRDAQAELDRRQGETRFDHQAGQSVYPTASGVGRHLGLAGGAKAQGRVVRLAGRAQSAQTGQGRGRGVGQQARPDRLGDHHHRRGLPHLHLRQGLIPIGGTALERRTQAQEFGERDDDVMNDTARRSKTIGHSAMGQEPKARPLDWEPRVVGLHQGQRTQSAPRGRT
jgi:transposase